VFPSENAGYKPLTARDVTISNIGNVETGTLTLTVSNANFRVNNGKIASIAVADTAKFTVVPDGNLSVGPYSATVTVSGNNGISAVFGVSFEVRPVPAHGITLSETETLVFEDAVLGYGDITPQPITVTNSGNQPTGGLTIGVSTDDFTLNKTSIDSLAVEDEDSFTVVPKTGLAAADEPYTATVSVTGGNGISESFEVSFTVIATYGIELSETGTYPFPSAILGYGAQGAKTVTISNTGNQPTGALTIGVTGTDFTLNTQQIDSIAVGTTGSFTVTPNTGLAAGTYTATITVSGSNGIFAGLNVSFTVTATYGIELGQTETLIFDEAIFGYTARTPQAVTIRNTGDQPTGGLTLSVSNGDFVLAPTTIANIAVEDDATFTVVPALGLAAGPHSATVTVSGGNGITAQSFGVSFYVIAATYGIELSRNGASIGADYTHPFGTVTLPNYTLPAALSVTVTNSGNQATGTLTVALGGNDSGSFTVTQLTPNSIETGGSATFTVVPKGDLAEAKTYETTVRVIGGNNISASFGVSFVVEEPQTLAGLVTWMAENKNLPSASYALPSGAETYTASLSLTTANSPASVTIDGGGRAITGSANSITVGTGITLTLKNITFTALPLTVAAGGTLILGSEGDAAGSAVVQNNASAGITVNGGTLELKAGALVRDNHASGIVLEDGSEFTMTGGEISGNEVQAEGGDVYGGGVLVNGSNSVFTMDGGTIKDNEAPFEATAYGHGGGVSIVDGGTFIMTGGSISDNKAYYGGGVRMKGDGGIFIMTGGAISGNETTNFGGGVYASDGVSFTLDGGVITGNKGTAGAGVRISGEGTMFTMDSGAISYNIASNYYYDKGCNYASGGGVGIGAGSVFYMNEGEVFNNASEHSGGGIYIYGAGTVFNMNGGVVKNNTAVLEGGGVYGGSDTFNIVDGEITGNGAGNLGGGVYLYESTIEGDPSIGTKDTSRGSIYDNDPDDVYQYQPGN
jgi:uncharacterized membrane protein